MKEIKNDIIKKFIYGDYVIYIKETSDTYESYLQNEKYGVIELMFGTPKNQQTLEEFISLVNNNIIEYIIEYREEYKEDQKQSFFALFFANLKADADALMRCSIFILAYIYLFNIKHLNT